MRKRNKVLVLIALVTLAVGMRSLVTSDESPQYGGRSLKAWFRAYRHTVLDNPTAAAGIAAALKGMGTNEMRYLLVEALTLAGIQSHTNILKKWKIIFPGHFVCLDY